MKTGIVGLGLIGASFAKALKKYTACEVLGADIDKTVQADALTERTVDAVLTPDNYAECDFLIVALFPEAAVRFVLDNGDYFSKDAIIFDVCGVKRYVCDALETFVSQKGLTFIGAHPMAGKEKFGYYYADGDLFQGASLILTPYEHTPEKACGALARLASELGFRAVIRTTPARHDAAIAYTSQLPHVISNAYVKSPTISGEAGFTAGSFQDLSRVARLNEEMWSELFLLNADSLIFELESLHASLDQYIRALKSRDAPRLKALLKEGRVIKENHPD